jgi:CRISPR-associated endonuclease/helicase Cas3
VSEIDYSLFDVDRENLLQRIKELIYNHLDKKEKVLIEFINKKTAEEFFDLCKEDIEADIYIITGDNNSIDRAYILESVAKTPDGTPLLLIATQVIEAGVDIQNIEVGFKDISLFDSEEQFFGRINRSNKGKGKVYFFDYNKVELLYKSDVRKDRELSLINTDMRQILIEKDFNKYYQSVMAMLKKLNSSLNTKYNIDDFWNESVGKLNQKEIAKRMQLIEDDNYSCQVYLARTIEDTEGEKIDGVELWNEYKYLLQNQGNEPYAVFKVKLSQIVSKMSNFIYRIKKSDFIYNDRIGEIYYIENGEDYFEDGRLLKDKFENGIGVFI